MCLKMNCEECKLWKPVNSSSAFFHHHLRVNSWRLQPSPAQNSGFMDPWKLLVLRPVSYHPNPTDPWRTKCRPTSSVQCQWRRAELQKQDLKRKRCLRKPPRNWTSFQRPTWKWPWHGKHTGCDRLKWHVAKTDCCGGTWCGNHWHSNLGVTKCLLFVETKLLLWPRSPVSPNKHPTLPYASWGSEVALRR